MAAGPIDSLRFVHAAILAEADQLEDTVGGIVDSTHCNDEFTADPTRFVRPSGL